jgi:uncharacterized protein YeaO (DUF488 family)
MFSHWQKALPDAVVEAFNEELARLFNGKSASICEKILANKIEEKGIKKNDLYAQNWLQQVVELYKERGWKVAKQDHGDDSSYNYYYHFSMP